MIERGAKHLAFMSRSGTNNPEAAALVSSLKSKGANITVLRADAASKTQVEAAIQELNPKFPIRGVVNAAVVLRDGFFENMTYESWETVQRAKMHTARNLHKIFSRPELKDLDFFVMTSSVSGALGSSGQSNYAAANTYLDALALHRRRLGLAGTSLILPMILGVGYFAEKPDMVIEIQRKGMYGIDDTEMLEGFEVAMTKGELDHVIVGMEPARLAKSAASTDANIVWLEEGRLRTLRAAMKNYTGREAAATSESILARVLTPTNAEDGIKVVESCLVERLSKLLMIDVKEFHAGTRSISSYGLDSMIGAEFRNWVFREFKTDVPFQQLLASKLTISKFAGELYEKCTGEDESVAEV